MDIVEFIEKLYHINLMEYQKQLVRKMYRAFEHGEKMNYIVLPHHPGFIESCGCDCNHFSKYEDKNKVVTFNEF